MDENGRKLTPVYEKIFSQKILVKNFKIIFQNPAKLSHKNAIKRGARNFRQFLAKCPIFCKKFLATLSLTEISKISGNFRVLLPINCHSRMH